MPRPRADTASLGTLGSPGRPLYRDAGMGRRTAGFYAPESGPLSALMANGMTLRARARALMRSNAWAHNGRETFVSNAIGRGIRPKFLFPDVEWARTARALWEDWTEEADAAQLVDFYGLEAMATREVFEAGEVFIRFRDRRPEDGLRVPLQLQVLESEHVPFWYTMPLPNGGWIKAGIEHDAIGRRVAYWLYPHHPGEFATQMSFDGYALKRIPAEQILHVFAPARAEAERGEPWLARVLLRLWGLDEYDDAELGRKRLAAAFGGVVTCLDVDKAGEKIGELHAEQFDARGGEPFLGVEPEQIAVLGPGEDFKPFVAADVGPNYGRFQDQQLRAIAAGSGLTYEMLTGDLSKVNYSSLRAGTLEFRRRCEQFQHHTIVYQFVRPVLGRWMDAAVLAGALAAPDYVARRREYQQAAFIPQGWQWVDPAKEVGAAVEEIRAGMTTLDRVIATRTGEDGATIAEEQAAINRRNDGLGLILDSDPRTTTKAPTGKTATGEETQIGSQRGSSGQGGQAGETVQEQQQRTGTND